MFTTAWQQRQFLPVPFLTNRVQRQKSFSYSFQNHQACHLAGQHHRLPPSIATVKELAVPWARQVDLVWRAAGIQVFKRPEGQQQEWPREGARTLAQILPHSPRDC